MAVEAKHMAESEAKRPMGTRDQITMKNGKWHVALIAGGPADIARETRDLLAQKRCTVADYHWPADKPKSFERPIPADVDYVLALTSFMDHSEFNLLRDACKRAKVCLITATHKKSHILTQTLTAQIDKRPVPLEVATTAVLKEDPAPRAEVKSAPAPRLAVVPAPKPPEPPKVQFSGNVLEALVQHLNAGMDPTPGWKGVPRPITCAIAALLQRMATEDEIEILVGPGGMTINPRRP